MDQTAYTTRRSFENAERNYSFLRKVELNYLSQFFPERTAHKDELDLFLAFRVHFPEGDIDELEQKCSVVDHLCLLLSPYYRHK